jgi:hypothetical protein
MRLAWEAALGVLESAIAQRVKVLGLPEQDVAMFVTVVLGTAAGMVGDGTMDETLEAAE